MKPTLGFIVAAVLLSAALASAAEPAISQPLATTPLVGVWQSTDAKPPIVPGVIELHADGTARLAPQGQPAQAGNWTASKTTLTLTLPAIGHAELKYLLKDASLTLTYQNGSMQHFSKDKAKK
jgi:hypothetical protein